MAAEILEILQSTDNCNDPGGVKYCYGTASKNVDFTDITVDASGKITDIGMIVSGAWALLYPDDDEDVAFVNETAPTDLNAATVYDVEGTIQWDGIDQEKVTKAGQAGLCCGVVLIAVYYSGLRRVFGVDVNPLTQAATVSKKKLKLKPALNSETGAGKQRLVYQIVGQQQYPAATTTLNDAAIEAL